MKIFTWCLEGSPPPIKNGPNPLWLASHMMTLKSFPKLYVPPSLINMTTMIRQYTNFPPLLLVPPGKPVHQAIHYLKANFRALLRGSVPNPMLITAFDTYFSPRSQWCSGYHYCTTSFYKTWTLVLRRFKSCSRRVGDSRWWESLTVVPAGNKAKPYHKNNSL